MELKEFIKITLKEITLGVKEAQEETKETGVIINPSGLLIDGNGNKRLDVNGGRYVENVEINVAVTVSEAEGKKAGLGVVTGLFSGGMASSNDANSSTVSTIKLKIPVALPVTQTPSEYESGGMVF